jgi:NADPH:quinone reductase-like Zn-dependent oxidoreductase
VFGIARGSFAEYAAAREDKLAHKPANLASSRRPSSRSPR